MSPTLDELAAAAVADHGLVAGRIYTVQSRYRIRRRVAQRWGLRTERLTFSGTLFGELLFDKTIAGDRHRSVYIAPDDLALVQEVADAHSR